MSESKKTATGRHSGPGRPAKPETEDTRDIFDKIFDNGGGPLLGAAGGVLAGAAGARIRRSKNVHEQGFKNVTYPFFGAGPGMLVGQAAQGGYDDRKKRNSKKGRK